MKNQTFFNKIFLNAITKIKITFMLGIIKKINILIAILINWKISFLKKNKFPPFKKNLLKLNIVKNEYSLQII